MAGWLESVTNPLSAATKTLQELMEVRDLVKFGDTFRKMNDEILAAQRSALDGYRRELSLLDEVGALKEKAAASEAWETEKNRYELKDLGWGSFAHMLKPEARGSQPAHWVCANCYSNRHISIIQYIQIKGVGYRHICPACKTELNAAPESLSGNNARWLE